MKIFYLTSTNSGGFEDKTRIAFSYDGDRVSVSDYPATEAPAILQLMTKICEKVETKCEIAVCSRRNVFRNAFEKGWIRDWIADGFKTRPKEYRSEWSRFHQICLDRRIQVRFYDLPIEIEHRLEQAIGKRARPLRDAPGDPFEDPWGSTPKTPDELFEEAVRKDE